MKIKGRVSRIFHRMESGFKIVALEVVKGNPIPEKYRNPDYPMSVSVVGNLMNAEEDYIVEIIGEWEYRDNGRYWPWQFKVEKYTVCDFETPCILVDIIASINGFGRTRAKRLVETYGVGVVQMIENEPQTLCVWETKQGEMQALSVGLKKYRIAADLKAFLSKYDIEEIIVDAVYERYGLESVEMIRQNPYVL